MVLSPFSRNLKGNKKGFSTVVAAIFMVLAVMFLFFNVFLFVQSQNAKLEDAISLSQRLDAEANAELAKVVIQAATCTQDSTDSSRFVVTCTIANNSPLPIQIVRVWGQIQNSPTVPPIAANIVPSSSIVLNPGGLTGPRSFTIVIAGADPGLSLIYVRFITSRGNAISASISI